MTSRKQHIDLAKGIAIILVVYGHAAAQMIDTDFYAQHLEIQAKMIFGFVMPFFFIISGALQRSRLESKQFSYYTYLVKVIISILLPFFSLSFIFLILNVALNKYINSPSIKDMICALLFMQSNGDLMPSGVLWYLFTLFCFAFFTYIWVGIFKIESLYLVIFALMLRIIHFSFFKEVHYFAIDKLSFFFLYYILGYVIFQYIVNCQVIANPKNIFVCLLIYLMLFFEKIYSHIDSVIVTIITASGISGVMGAFFVIGVCCHISTKSNNNIFKKFIIYCGQLSILIYVFHMPTFTLLKIIAESFNCPNNYLKQFILFFPGVLLPLFYGKLLSFDKRIYRVLLGRTP